MHWRLIGIAGLLLGSLGLSPKTSGAPPWSPPEEVVCSIPGFTEMASPCADVAVISLQDLLTTPDTYHQQTIVVRGIVKRLELHVDESTLFVDYVFWLQEGTHRVLVFGHHDRTKGDIQMVTDRRVEVRGIFWKERFSEGYRLKNNLEAQFVRFYPPVSPDQA